MADIRKAGGILIQDRKILVTRAKGKTQYFAPGGKIQSGETAEEALIRELKEELTITVEKSSIRKFGTFEAPAADRPELILHMDVFEVLAWSGGITASHEIEELLWIDSRIPPQVVVGSVFEHEVIPRLHAQGRIT